MASSRRPRFRRTSTVAPIQLTERDREIMRSVHRYRFLRSPQLASLVGEGSQQLLRRLQLLYHHGYLERPRAQLDYFHQGGSRHIVYGLGSKGATLLKREFGVDWRELAWAEKNRAVGGIFLEHALLVSEVMVAIELACRQNDHIKFLIDDELPIQGSASSSHQPFKWYVNTDRHLTLGVIPDRVFALDFSDHRGERDRVLFFLEADRGTMPVTRRNFSQTSFYRKLVAYEATWSNGLHRTLFGYHRFRLLTVTTSSARVQSLVDACSQLKRGHGLFLFGERSALQKPEIILSPIWRTGKSGELGSLLK